VGKTHWSKIQLTKNETNCTLHCEKKE